MSADARTKAEEKGLRSGKGSRIVSRSDARLKRLVFGREKRTADRTQISITTQL